MHIGRPVVIHPNYDEDILDVSVDSSTSDQQDAAKHGQFICLHYMHVLCHDISNKQNCIARYTWHVYGYFCSRHKFYKQRSTAQLFFGYSDWKCMLQYKYVLHAHMRMYTC